MDCSMPGFPVHHRLPELAQTHVHRVGDATQPPHPMSKIIPSALLQHLELSSFLCGVFVAVVVYRLIDSFDYIGSYAALRVWTAARGICIVSWDLLLWCTDSLAVVHELSS